MGLAGFGWNSNNELESDGSHDSELSEFASDFLYSWVEFSLNFSGKVLFFVFDGMALNVGCAVLEGIFLEFDGLFSSSKKLFLADDSTCGEFAADDLQEAPVSFLTSFKRCAKHSSMADYKNKILFCLEIGLTFVRKLDRKGDISFKTLALTVSQSTKRSS